MIQPFELSGMIPKLQKLKETACPAKPLEALLECAHKYSYNQNHYVKATIRRIEKEGNM